MTTFCIIITLTYRYLFQNDFSVPTSLQNCFFYLITGLVAEAIQARFGKGELIILFSGFFFIKVV